MPDMTLAADQHLYYEEAGSGAPVIFLHSALGDLRQWDAQVHALSDQFHCIRYDLRGYGKSSSPHESFDPAMDLLSLMDHLGIVQAALVGSSLGGSVALHAAVRYPTRVTKAALLGTGIFGFAPPEVHDSADALAEEYEAVLQSQDVDALIAFFDKLWLRGIQGDDFQVPQAARALFWTMNEERLLQHREDDPDYGNLDDVPDLGTVSRPLLTILGQWDTDYCQKAAQHLVSHVPNVTLELIPGTAHFPNLTHPDLVSALLRNWLG